MDIFFSLLAHNRRCVVVALMLLVALCLTATGVSRANTCLHKKRTQIPVVLETELNSKAPDNLKAPFVMRLADSVTNGVQNLPAGTELKGIIISSKCSRRLDRPAFMIVQLLEVDLEGKAPIEIPLSEQPKTRVMIQPASNRTFQHFVLENGLLENSSLVVSIPLTVAADASAGLFTVADTAASVVIGAIYGLQEHPKLMVLNPDLTPYKTPIKHRFWHVVNTVYESVSPIPPVWELGIRPKDFDFKPGTILSVPIQTSLFQTIFKNLPANS